MSRFHILLSAGIILSFTVYVAAQNNGSRCFQFTWLGPRYNNDSEFLNATCSDATQLAQGVPCFKPLVASFDGSMPDVNYIWNNYPEASCSLADNDVCAQYTFFFNGLAENSSYFCTRAVDDQGNAVRSGCHRQVNGSHTTQVCFCRSLPGRIPCNNGIIPSINYFTFTVIVLAFMFQLYINPSRIY